MHAEQQITRLSPSNWSWWVHNYYNCFFFYLIAFSFLVLFTFHCLINLNFLARLRSLYLLCYAIALYAQKNIVNIFSLFFWQNFGGFGYIVALKLYHIKVVSYKITFYAFILLKNTDLWSIFYNFPRFCYFRWYIFHL